MLPKKVQCIVVFGRFGLFPSPRHPTDAIFGKVSFSPTAGSVVPEKCLILGYHRNRCTRKMSHFGVPTQRGYPSNVSFWCAHSKWVPLKCLIFVSPSSQGIPSMSLSGVPTETGDTTARVQLVHTVHLSPKAGAPRRWMNRPKENRRDLLTRFYTGYLSQTSVPRIPNDTKKLTEATLTPYHMGVNL